MAVIQGTFTVNGIPRNGATFKLWPAGAFSGTPAKDDALPSGSPSASGTTGPAHGHDGGYRISGVTVGEYYVSFEWNGSRTYDYHARNINPVVNVKDFGALGDGSTNDLVAINSAINSASTSGATSGATVYFPAGTYIVSASGSQSNIILKSNVLIRGEGKSSVIKVRSNNGAYQTLIGASPSGATVSGVTIRDLVIDQNVSGVTGAVAASDGARQFAIALYAFDDINLDNVHFKGAGTNTVTLNGATAKRASVRNCWFEFTPSGGVAAYDNSALYFNCEQHSAVNNLFTSPAASGGARGAIETHNGLSCIANNRSVNYQTIVNVVNESSSQSRNGSTITVVGNTAYGAAYGIRLWSTTAGVELKDVSILGNTIQLNQAQHGFDTYAGISMVDSSDGTLSGLHRNILIANNTISCEDEAASGRAATGSTSSAFGIGLSPRGDIENVVVIGNIVENAPIRALRLGNEAGGTTSRGIIIRNNQFLNAGRNVGISEVFRAAVVLEGILEDVQITDNHIRDTRTAFNGYQSFFVDSSTDINRVTVSGNTIQTRSGGTGYKRTMSATLGIATGEPALPKYVDSFPPSTGSYDPGDFVYERRAATEVGSMRLYRVTASGTYGTTSILATTTTGSAFVNTTATGLLVGDYITIAGVSGTKRVVWSSGTVIEVSSTPNAAVTNAAVSYVAPTTHQVFPREYLGSAAPVAGTFKIGDRVWNSAPATGSPLLWVCTVSGTPGTWITGATSP